MKVKVRVRVRFRVRVRVRVRVSKLTDSRQLSGTAGARPGSAWRRVLTSGRPGSAWRGGLTSGASARAVAARRRARAAVGWSVE